MVHGVSVPFGEERVCATHMGMVARDENGACKLFMGIVKKWLLKLILSI